jgi:hypothetical protein
MLAAILALIVSMLPSCGSGGSFNLNRFIHPGSELSIFNLRGQGRFPFELNAQESQIERDSTQASTLGPDVGKVDIFPGGPIDGVTVELPSSFQSALSTPRIAHFETSERVDPLGGTFDTFVQGSVASGSLSTFTLLNTDFGGSGLDYTTYGIWEYNTYDNSGALLTTRATAVAFGFATVAKDMPNTGMATYNGRMDGSFSDTLAPNQAVNGAVSLVADFQTTDISVNFTGVTVGGQAFRDLSGTGSITNNTFVDTKNRFIGGFNGTLATDPIQPGQIGPDMHGSLQGNFYGPSANEIGGVFEMEGGSAVMNGAFVGSQ